MVRPPCYETAKRGNSTEEEDVKKTGLYVEVFQS